MKNNIIRLNNWIFNNTGKRLSVKYTNNLDKVSSNEYKQRLSIKLFLISSCWKLSSFRKGK